MDAYDNLINLWRTSTFENAPYLLPEDESVINTDRITRYLSFEDFINSKTFCKKGDTGLHLGLLPVPYVGNLLRASIFLLSLNPGYSPGDYATRPEGDDFINAQKRNIYQTNQNDDFPFFCLNPEFAWTPGFDYWQRKFDTIAQELVKMKAYSYPDALKIISQRIACIELFPYHSSGFGAHMLINSLPSVEAIRNFIMDVIIPRAMDGEIKVIVLRSNYFWRCKEVPQKIVVYKNSEPRGAHITTKSRGGELILEHLLSL